ncbi:MAG TPA: DDE-type integrase/transposase/recombinase [Nitrososphaera sp.]|nr:DDE-type integrase/transposase/recombinase [Nitrososphaera sp.]
MKTFDRDGRKIRGYAIISKGDTPEKLKRGVWRIPSQSGNGSYLVQAHVHKGVERQLFECSCPDWNNNIQDCKHIHAIRFWLDTKEKVENHEPMQAPAAQTYTVNICPCCKSQHIIKRGKRKNALVEKQTYACKDCGKRFVLDVARNTKGDGNLVTLCLDLYFKGISLRKIQDHLLQFYGFEISHMTIQRWIRRFMALANQHAKAMQPKVEVGGLWHTDEQMIRNNGKFLYVWNCIDAKTRFLLANNVTEGREVWEARQIFAKTKPFGQPDIIMTDGLPAYSRAVKKEFSTWTSSIKHVRADGLRSKKKNNNMVERFHNTFRERDKVMRGFKGQKNAEFLAEAFQTYYNFVRPNQALSGLTPSEVAGIKSSGNKWKVLLEHAAQGPQ